MAVTANRSGQSSRIPGTTVLGGRHQSVTLSANATATSHGPIQVGSRIALTLSANATAAASGETLRSRIRRIFPAGDRQRLFLLQWQRLPDPDHHGALDRRTGPWPEDGPVRVAYNSPMELLIRSRMARTPTRPVRHAGNGASQVYVTGPTTIAITYGNNVGGAAEYLPTHHQLHDARHSQFCRADPGADHALLCALRVRRRDVPAGRLRPMAQHPALSLGRPGASDRREGGGQHRPDTKVDLEFGNENWNNEFSERSLALRPVNPDGLSDGRDVAVRRPSGGLRADAPLWCLRLRAADRQPRLRCLHGGMDGSRAVASRIKRVHGSR